MPDPLLSAPIFVAALVAAFSLKGGWVATAIIAAGGAAGWGLLG